MDIKDYISSGIIEAYVLGLATEEEVSILDCVRQKHPEVEQAILEAQLVLEDFASEQAIQPAPELKDSIWNILSESPSKASDAGNKEIDFSAIEKESNDRQPHRLAKSLAIAATVLLVLSLGTNIYWYQQQGISETKFSQALQYINAKELQLAEADKRWKIVQQPAVQKVSLRGTENKSELQAVVFWNKEDKTVYLTSGNLPATPTGKQYQLWAIVDGKPVDAGLLPREAEEGFFKMNDIPHAQTFAITLEKEGGSPTPTLADLFVIGNI
ncbi:anti-sigma factor [Sphingobacterium sp. LRF_L2]|uniref:anti-sigma factor n=1 Tax=Sphingobacterium sp. LRF_L2 TaxID=3369421 RepID=UPI003F5E50B9